MLPEPGGSRDVSCAAAGVLLIPKHGSTYKYSQQGPGIYQNINLEYHESEEASTLEIVHF